NVVAHEDSALSRALTKAALATGRGFIVHSAQDEANLRRMFPGRAIRHAIHPSFEFFRAAGLTREEARGRLGVEGNVVLFFGIVRPYKGLEYLLRAMPRVLESTEVTALVVGEFWEPREKYEKLIEQLGIGGRVRIVGEYVPNEDVELYFAAADLVALPYRSATGSGVVQVAYAFERPVVATSVGCFTEVVRDGRTGYLVPQCDSEALALAIARFFSKADREAMSRAIRAEREKFSWNHLVETIEGLAQEIARRRAASRGRAD
ncbi:MAG: glycosyltransferase, partial [Planctomycetota bacterium]